MKKTTKPAVKQTLPQHITIKRSETEPESMELVAKAVLDLADGFKRILDAGVKRQLVVLLLHDMTGVGKPAIRLILDAAPRIAATYLNR